MAINFLNPLTAGTVLIREAIESENYQTGIAGWIIKQNGDVEFNSGIFRGTLNAATIIGSLFETSATDPSIVIDSASSTITFYDAAGNVDIEMGIDPGFITSYSGVAAVADASLSGGLLQFFDGVSPIFEISGDVTDTLLKFENQLNGGVALNSLGYWVKLDPATSTAETWHPAVAVANWSVTTLEYMITPEGDIRYFGEIIYTGANVAGSGAAVVTTASAAKFRPSANGRDVVAHLTTGSVVKNVNAVAQINTTGTVSIFWGSGVAGTVNDVNGLATGDRFSIDCSIPL